MNRLVGILHPFGDAPFLHRNHMLSLCFQVAAQGDIPICPGIYFPAFLDDDNAEQRQLGLEMSCHLLTLCREVRQYGPATEGMAMEIEAVERADIPIVRLTLSGQQITS